MQEMLLHLEGGQVLKARFLSFGAGVQTTSLLLSEPHSYDEVVFADTGGEHPETYAYIESIVKPFIAKEGIKFTVVRGCELIDGVEVHTLEEACLRWKKTPSRHHRWSTDRFKIRPIRRYVREQGWERPSIAVMGISYDEAHRIHDPHWSEYIFEYPLVERRITREDCKRIIERLGYQVPPKSGCFFCPFMRKEGWRRLYLQHPDLFERARKIEELDASFPKYVLSGNGVPLSRLCQAWGEGSANLDDWVGEEDSCDSGACFT